jgi:lactoylglutathione lyase
VRLSYTIIFVSDMAQAVTFYRDVVGLPVRFESPSWTEFNTEGSTLALHASEAGPKRDPARHWAGQCRPGLSVPDLDQFHQRMIEHNVPCLQAPKETFGARIAQYVDPDGLAISVSQERQSGR